MTGSRTIEAKPRREAVGLAHAVPAGRHRPDAGFTYIGVLVLVAVMGLAVTLASELWQTAQKREKEQELLFVGDQFRRALALYSANGGGNPRRLEDLLRDSRIPGVRRYLRKIYRDPITGGTEWGLVKAGGTDGVITGVYSLSGAAPLKQSEFSLADKQFEGKTKYSEWVFAAKATQGASGATAPVGAAALTPAVAGAASPAASGVATTADSAVTTPEAAGATQTDTTLNRAQSRVRR